MPSHTLGRASDHPCVLCGAPAQSWQHRVPRSRGGPWDRFNCVPLCGSGTTGCHGYVEHHPAAARRLYLEIPGSFMRGRYVGADPGYRWHYNREVWVPPTDNGGGYWRVVAYDRPHPHE